MKPVFTLFLSLLFILSQAQNIDCYTIAVGKKASATGRVIIAHNEDDYGDLIVNLYKVPSRSYPPNSSYQLTTNHKIPQAKRTNEYLWFETTKQNFGDFMINGYGVAVCSNACTSKEDTAKGIIGYDLRKIAIERAKTAKQAVKIAGKLIEKYGYESSGRTYCFADKNEAWLLAVVKGRHWAAQRVPDDKVAIIPNYYTIEEINLADTNNFLASADIIDYAVKRHWYVPSRDKKFNFRKAYSNELNLYAFWNIPRHWQGINIITGKQHGLYEHFPFAVTPKHKISNKDLAEVLASHYEGTDFETCPRQKTNPHKSTINRICNTGTKFSIIIPFKDKPYQNIIWFAPFNPCINPYIPISYTIELIPSYFQKHRLKNALAHHFDKNENTFEQNPQHAFTVFHNYNQSINDDYWTKSKQAKIYKNKFEQKARQLISNKPNEKTSISLLMEYYNYCKNNN